MSRRTSGCTPGEGSLLFVSFHLSPQKRYPYLIGVGEYTAVSDASVCVSTCGRRGLDSPFELSLSAPDPLSAFGELDFFSSFNLFSNPSTRFNKASNTSVFGPRFFGTASISLLTIVQSNLLELAHHKCMGTGRPDRPRKSVATGCT